MVINMKKGSIGVNTIIMLILGLLALGIGIYMATTIKTGENALMRIFG